MMKTTESESGSRALAAGGTALAGTLMVVEGLLSVLQGIAAIAKDDVYAVVGKYAYKFNITAWGWIHLVVGVLVLVAGFAVFTGSVLARTVGVVLAVLAVVANFLYLPYQPFWSIIMIGLGFFVIWSLFHDIGPERV
ncbi:DUF7144 family membrane protein [Catenulispora pinisilvae]|uniref:DUF7144 family membrane protein n=1 Tax=Catenulispora pinisilvae TaxID=2705253 RepID=UPI001E33123A|nr:hypothetical protein [Catenulispora pinisilvae]